MVSASSPKASERSLRNVAGGGVDRERWLDSPHPYENDVIKALKGKSIDAPRLGEYVACSALLHVVDGWNYLSRAFGAASFGDHNSAYHLAYYAELRAAMALLATEGIGIFSNRHIALSDCLDPTAYDTPSTHVATWSLLSAWSQEANRAARLLDAISVGSKSLSDWLEEVGVVEPARQLFARDWLEAWSVDLEMFSSDRVRRNELSYRPSGLRMPTQKKVDPILEMADPVFHSWAVLEPLTNSKSVALDLSLLREALSLAASKGLCRYDKLEEVLKSLEKMMPDHILSALSTPDAYASALFREAKVKSTPGSGATPILARALLLLRLSSARIASMFAAAEVSKIDIKFWWSLYGSNLGLWEYPDDVEVFSDLWSDVAEAKDDAGFRISAMTGAASVRRVGEILSRDMSLTQFSRAPMWLLGLD